LLATSSSVNLPQILYEIDYWYKAAKCQKILKLPEGRSLTALFVQIDWVRGLW